MHLVLEKTKEKKAEVVEPRPEEIRVETLEEKEAREQAERRHEAEVARLRLGLMKYFGQQRLTWEQGLAIFRENAKGRFDGMAPEVLGEVGKGVLSYIKAILLDVAKAGGLDEKVRLIERAPEAVLKPGVNPLGSLTEGAPIVGTALSATKFIGGKLEAIHQQHLGEVRAATISDLVKMLIDAGDESLSAWREFIEQAGADAIERLAQRIDPSKPLFYGADVASLCERLLFQAMSKVQTARETIHHMSNLRRFIAEDMDKGINEYGPGFAPPKEQR